MGNKKHYRFHTIYFFLAIWGVIFLQNIWSWQTQVTHLPYSEFLKHLQQGNIVEVVQKGEHLHGAFKEPIEGRKEFVTIHIDEKLSELLAKHQVKFGRVVESEWLSNALGWIVPTLIFFSLWIYLSRRLQNNLSGGFMTLGKSRAKIYVEQDTKTTFKDVAGVNEAKLELEEVVGFLKNPENYQRLGARTPKGVLLVGPPGTGKTLLARAVAGEAGVPFFSISGSEFVEMFVGLGAARVRDLFEQARTKAPCIIFIDELDALGKSRHTFQTGGHDEKEQTLNQLLVEMDGFDSSSRIVLLAATNRPEVLDPALLRAGRFDRQVLVDRPDKADRLEILKVHIRKIKIENGLELEKVAELTPGFTGADLANLVNEAAIFATRRKAHAVSLSDFTLAMERIVAGLEKRSRILSSREREIIAHHEMGHALIAASLPSCDPVHKISIIPRGIGALGYTLQRPTEDRYITTEAELKNRIQVLLGGRAAELLIFNHLSTGAADDIQKATNIAKDMVTRFGMNSKLGSVAYDEGTSSFLARQSDLFSSQKNFSNETAREIEIEVKNLIDEALNADLEILKTNQHLLKQGAQLLLQKETLEENDLKDLFSRIKNKEHEHNFLGRTSVDAHDPRSDSPPVSF